MSSASKRSNRRKNRTARPARPAPRASAAVHDTLNDPDDLDDLDDAVEPLTADRWAGTAREQGGGAGREYGWLLVIGGVLGAFAAAMLNIEYIHKLIEPDASLICDINPFITCGEFLGTPQSSAFGFPNIVIGMVAFPVVVTTGVLLLAGVQLPRWYWRGLLGGMLFGIGFVTWLQYQALVNIRAICPWCALVWLVMIPMFVHTVARTVQNGALGGGSGLRSLLVQYRWVWTGLWWLIVAAAAFIALADRWASLF